MQCHTSYCLATPPQSLRANSPNSLYWGYKCITPLLKQDHLFHKFHAKIVEVEIGGVAIYRLLEEFRQANSYCHMYGAQGQDQRQAYF
ncbi:hypothetical protein TNCV_774711 [Trichonephila clavipes]|nr:hypothetical protein TNCV_774711 [Trichonephila clavipes]